MPNTQHILSVLADNPALIEEVRTLLVKQFDTPPAFGPDTSDVVLGQYLRAKMLGVKAVDAAIKELSQYRTIPESQKRINGAR